ncbi:MAG: HEAT repeat domain-containing protein [Terriglobia bacterium]
MADSNPHVAAFVGKVREAYHPNLPESFWDCEGPFRRLLDSSFLVDIINEELRRVAAGTEKASNWMASELVLHRGGGLGLSISVFEGLQRYIHALPYHAMYSAAGGGKLSCNAFRLPVNYRNETFDPSLRLIQDGSLSKAPGEVFHLHSNTHAYSFISDGPTLVVKFMTAAIRPLEWLFSRSGLQAWQANDADLSFTQLRVAADVAGRFAHQSSLDPLKHLTHHEHHAVRWAAIQNLARISRSEAMARLREAASDPHPHVQRAAQKTLQKLEVTQKQ